MCQLDEIEKNILVLKKKYRFEKNMKIMLSGIGQTVLKNYLMKKNYNVDYLYNFLNKGSYRFASLHAPALSIALLLSEKK